MNVRRTSLLLSVFLLLSVSTAAQAGRRPFVIGQDSAMVPDGDVEIETWLDYVWNPPVPASTDWSRSEWIWWLGPRWAPIENVEVAALTAFQQDDAASQWAQLWAELFTARWKVLNHASLGSVSLQLDFRLPLAHDVLFQLAPSAAWATHVGRFGFNAQLGYTAGFRGKDVAAGSRYHWLTWNAGVSVDAVRGEVWPVLQVGVEAFSEVVLQGSNELTNRGTTLNVGPTVSIARGRLWFTLGALFGVTSDSPNVFLRGVLGVAL